MNLQKTLAFFMAALMLFSIAIISMPEKAKAASAAKTLSFRVSENGVEVNKKQTVTFTAELDTNDVYDLGVYNENNRKVATLKQNKDGKYSATVTLSENERATHTYTLNTLNGDEYNCNIEFYNPITTEDLKKDDTTWDTFNSYYRQLDKKGLNDTDLLKVLFLCLSMDKNVSSVWYETDRIINFETADGVGNVFDLDMVSSRRVNKTSQFEVTANDTEENTIKTTEPLKADEYIGSKKIRVIAPYYGVEDDFTTRYVDEAERIANVIGGSVTASYGNGSETYPSTHDTHPNQKIGTGKADVTAFKNLDQYGIIMVDSHGSLYNNQSLICVHYQTGTTSADFSAKRLVRYDDPEDSSYDYVGVLGAYISYYSNSLPDSIVFLGSCYGMYSTHLQNAFTGLGASFITGFSKSVAFLFETKLFNEYFKCLRTPNSETGKLYTTKEAYDSAVDRFGAVDNLGSEHARWKYYGNSNIRIGEYTAPVPLQSFTLSPKNLTVKIGETAKIEVATDPVLAVKTCTMVWDSFDPDTATVDEDGVVTGIEEGQTTIVCAITDRFGTTLNGSIVVEVVDEATPTPTPTPTPGPEVILGDVTGDGDVNTGDAVMILKFASGAIDFTTEQLMAADTTKDGFANTGDAVAILKLVAGIITEF